MKTKIIADSSCDMFELKGVDFVSVPLTISIDGKDYVDDKDLNVSEMQEALATHKGHSSTACPGIGRWVQAFGDADVIYVAVLTGKLSGTYNAAMSARDIYLQRHPNVKIHVFDTQSTGPELRLFVEKLAEWVRLGKQFDEVVPKGEAYLLHTHLFFSLESLHNLAQNGRVNPLIASTIGVLGIRVLGTASSEGKLEVVDKCRGEKRLRAALLKNLDKVGYHGGKVRIAHVDNLELAENIKDDIEKKYAQADIVIYPTRGLCSYYAEKGGILLGCE